MGKEKAKEKSPAKEEGFLMEIQESQKKENAENISSLRGHETEV